MTTAKVYESINAIAAALGKSGISKDRQGTGNFSYKFRGIDDVYAALSPLLAEHKLCILPNVLERTCDVHTSSKGTTLFYVNLKVKFDIVSAIDGSVHSIVTMGEAMDTGDKATNKAMSTAYKYAAFMTFCIPTEGDNDTENTTFEVKSPLKKWAEAPPKGTSDQDKLTEASEVFLTKLRQKTSREAVDILVASNNALMKALHDNLPERFETISKEINQHQEAFDLANKAPF